ncbi:MAG TPA: ferritin-like domain-containing protein [Actinomycetota bacterium]|nr:ferritin-like domain-containing protein [Actinomycetota bacterium]
MDKTKLIELLNDDLAHELQAVLTYLHQYATAGGLKGHELREILEPEIVEELDHAKFLADKIVSLGGKPKLQPAPFEEHADVKAMLEYDLSLEKEAIQGYTERAEQAKEFGDVGLSVRLEDMVADETEHAETIERLLRGFSDF